MPGQSRLRCAVLIAAAVLLTAGASPSPAQTVDERVLRAEQQRSETIREASRSVVAIFGQTEQGGGSGVLISPDGYALSNYHVTSGAGDFMKCGLNDGRLYDAVIVGVDPTGDVALIKLFGEDPFPFASMGDSDSLRAGDWVYAMGNPFLLATDFSPTVTYGIVSGVHRYQYPAGTFLEYTDCIQVDASINPGNSGGPLFDATGKLVGINGRASFEKRGRINSGAAYAISINQVRHFLDHLRSGRIVDHATLGATVAAQPDGSVAVDQILEDSEAWRRGLREGSEILSFAGRPVRSVNQFKNVLGIYPSGWKLPLTFREGADVTRTFVRLRPLHSELEMAQLQRPARPRPGQRGGPPQPQGPEKYRSMLIKRPGFANYYFNELHQKRLQEALAGWGDFSEKRGTWILRGNSADGRSVEFVLAADGVGLVLGDDNYYQHANDLVPENEPAGSGGLLTAMHHLRLLLTGFSDGFTRFEYVGTEPIDGEGMRVDVLKCVDADAESRWYFGPPDKGLLGFDARPSSTGDECEVRIREVRAFDGLVLPSRFELTRGGERFGEFVIEDVELRSTGKETR